ncbi:MAG: aldehyde dehydrogenase family protein [Spirochaetia bacterium]|nr:aldehyde dehydrogenase family protein [Spirochaetia bacterium]
MLSVHNPANGQLIQNLEEDTATTIAAKFGRAKHEQKKWSAVPFSKRAQAIAKFRDLLVERLEELAQTMSQETGKPITQARNEIRATPGRIDFFLEHAESAMREELAAESEATGGTREVISFEPLGVIANISAWNYPYFVGSNVFVPALLTGNTVLYKPSEMATLTGLKIDSLLHEAGIPADAFITIVGGGAAGSALLEQNIQGVFFTGSYSTGQKIAQAAASKMIRVQLELGGKDPAYVCEDVNVANAAESLAEGAFYNAGQSCCAIERIYVHEKIYDAFLDKFLSTAKGYEVGDPTKDSTFVGPLTRSQQIEILEAQVQEASSKGARVLLGGKRLTSAGNYFEPTVVADADQNLRIMREESFGPVIGIQKVKSDAEAIERMNDTEYGLTAGVYSQNESRAREILAQMDSGSVYWNCCDRVSPRLPWTGRRHSGIGSTLSVIGIRAFLQPKAWHLRAPK